ncbi:hypothetical protein ONZ45_g4530 [Pleurotus djamor]|nr:hypothetical protein ONZ45_g4530 [Pleurotus djamor]
MFPHSALPQEIYDIVINYLHDDKQSLKACSLVASAWRPASQKLLHQTLVCRASDIWPLPTETTESSAQSSVRSSEQAHLLLHTSSHLLQYARSLVICEDLAVPLIFGDGIWRPKLRVPDASLVSLLRTIHSLALPSLTSVILRNLIWTAIEPNLQRALILLLHKESIKEVSLVGCAIPSGVRWLWFVGPETKSLKFDELKLFNDLDAELEAPIRDLSISSAPNLVNLDIGRVYMGQINEWILRSSNAPGDHLGLTKTGVHIPSFRKGVTTLSLRRHHAADVERLCEFIEAFSGLTTLKFNPGKQSSLSASSSHVNKY